MSNAVILIAQLIFGFLVKRVPALEKWPTKLVPIFNFILGVLIALGQQVAHADDGSSSNGPWWHLFVRVAVNTLLATGTHSAIKNTVQHARGT